MRRLFSKFLILTCGLVYAAGLIKVVRGEWSATHSTIENYSTAAQSNPENPAVWTSYADYLLYDSRNSKFNAAANAYQQAITLNPLDPRNWDGLTTAYLQAGDTAKAEAALRGWFLAVPLSPDAAWRMGNFLVLQDRVKEALPYLKDAGQLSPPLRAPLFELAWKLLGDPEEILHELIPSDPKVREEYLLFLLQTKRVGNAWEVWRTDRNHHGGHSLGLGYFLIEELITADMGEEAANVWEDLLSDTGRTWTKPAGELMTNGDFEAGLPNQGLDWRISLLPGFQIALDDSMPQSGSHSLKVTFDGTSNPDFAHVTQAVPVEPNHDYRFRGYLKTDNITSDSGLRFELLLRDPTPGQGRELRTESRLGVNPWTQEQVDFRTGPSTHFVIVILRRLRSSTLNNMIKGSVWIDNLSLSLQP